MIFNTSHSIHSKDSLFVRSIVMSHNKPGQSEQSDDDSRSEAGDAFESAPAATRPSVGGSAAGRAAARVVVPPTGVTRGSPRVARAVGRGPVAPDPRKFRYDVTRARAMPKLAFGASRADRMDAGDAGALLDRIHQMCGIDRETEDVIAAFDKALFFEHTINGASLLQPGRGVLRVGSSEFETQGIKQVLGTDQRRFFRAFADDIALVNREVLAAYDAHDPISVEMHGQVMQVAVERGLQKYPYLAHDASDAGVRLSVEERNALMVSKRVVLEGSVNRVDAVQHRVGGSRAADAAN